MPRTSKTIWFPPTYGNRGQGTWNRSCHNKQNQIERSHSPTAKILQSRRWWSIITTWNYKKPDEPKHELKRRGRSLELGRSKKRKGRRKKELRKMKCKKSKEPSKQWSKRGRWVPSSSWGTGKRNRRNGWNEDFEEEKNEGWRNKLPNKETQKAILDNHFWGSEKRRRRRHFQVGFSLQNQNQRPQRSLFLRIENNQLGWIVRKFQKRVKWWDSSSKGIQFKFPSPNSICLKRTGLDCTTKLLLGGENAENVATQYPFFLKIKKKRNLKGKFYFHIYTFGN